ncbi:hypothetical protein JIN84_13485 [Luteolibacter yonseiensis]|uniref:Uncharacterized protein n=1 Tax=Luteolibacter yonseiensis TaxID=1144680 RepID=A0A934R5A4_9BACT|nr:hypothetical protein [Luteolibacter yonseiensis]MBK1816632.1 hypothetical protein [Luteolibacter yonseiensis]
MKRYIIPSVIAVVFIAFGVWWFSPAQVVKRRCNSLLSALTMDAGSGNVSRQAGAFSLNALLSEEVKLETPTISEANGTFERAELESAHSWLSGAAKETRFELQDFRSVTVNGDRATVELTLTGLVVLPTYRPVDGTYDVTFQWANQKDGWRLTSATWTEILKQ